MHYRKDKTCGMATSRNWPSWLRHSIQDATASSWDFAGIHSLSIAFKSASFRITVAPFSSLWQTRSLLWGPETSQEKCCIQWIHPQFVSNLPLGHGNEMFVWQFWHGMPLLRRPSASSGWVGCRALGAGPLLTLLMHQRLLPGLTSTPDKAPLFEPCFPVLRVRHIATKRHLTLQHNSEKRKKLFCRSLFPGLFLLYDMKIGLPNAIARSFSELR